MSPSRQPAILHLPHLLPEKPLEVPPGTGQAGDAGAGRVYVEISRIWQRKIGVCDELNRLRDCDLELFIERTRWGADPVPVFLQKTRCQ